MDKPDFSNEFNDYFILKDLTEYAREKTGKNVTVWRSATRHPGTSWGKNGFMMSKDGTQVRHASTIELMRKRIDNYK